ncbi:Egg cell-secreted protein 1.1 [Melia azedarach]|uniref:Egg cell-secreted protein 1.1 n=1 Tax=Melia azedarach TaxID=155640 RepID=A0ACC1WQ51_MELAZ|nr:Egg cell-secreted protein 1.1 [Melia azedarach]
MANAFNLFVLTLVLALMTGCPASARPASNPNPRPSLVSRLKLDGESLNCWDSLIQIQSCTGEIILFFLNGETYLGNGCCEAIRIIGKQCWPNMIDTLGFTDEEGDVLEGYCDSNETPVAAAVHTRPPSVEVNSRVQFKELKS